MGDGDPVEVANRFGQLRPVDEIGRAFRGHVTRSGLPAVGPSLFHPTDVLELREKLDFPVVECESCRCPRGRGERTVNGSQLHPQVPGLFAVRVLEMRSEPGPFR